MNEDARPRQTSSVDQGRVVISVGNDDITAADKRTNKADIGLITGGEQQRGFTRKPCGHTSLALLVQRRPAAEQSCRTAACAKLTHGRHHRVDYCSVP
jgi:hypothetical protein